MSIMNDDGSIIDDDYEPSETPHETTEDPIEQDTTTNTATGDTISAGEGADYVYGENGDDFIMSGFWDDGFYY